MLKLTKTGIGLLTRQYRSVLRKCWLLNLGLFTLGAAMVPNEAEAIGANNFSLYELIYDGGLTSNWQLNNMGGLRYRLMGSMLSSHVVDMSGRWVYGASYSNEDIEALLPSDAIIWDYTYTSNQDDIHLRYATYNDLSEDDKLIYDFLQKYTGGLIQYPDWNSNSDGQGHYSQHVSMDIGADHLSSDSFTRDLMKAIMNASDSSGSGGSGLTAGMALVSDSNGKVAASAVTAAELGYLSGVSSNIQTQLNNKQETISDLATIRNNAATGAAKVSANDTTVTVKMNGANKTSFTLNNASNQTIDLGTVITEHQSLNDYYTKSQVGSTPSNGNNYIGNGAFTTTHTVAGDLKALDTQVKTNADNISAETTNRQTADTNIVTGLTNFSDIQIDEVKYTGVQGATSPYNAKTATTTLATVATVGAAIDDILTNNNAWTGTNTFKGTLNVNNGNTTNFSVTTGGAITGKSLDLGTGSITSGAITSSGAISGASLSTTGAATIGNGLTVSAGGATITKGGLTVSAGGADITGDSTFNNKLTVTGATTLSSTLGVTGATTLGSTLTADGTSTFAKDSAGTYSLQATDSAVTVNKAMTVNANTSISGANTFTVGTGATTLGGTLGVTGVATFANNIISNNGKTFTMNSGNGVTPQIVMNGSNGDLSIYNSTGQAIVAQLHRGGANGAASNTEGQLILSHYTSSTNATKMALLSSTSLGGTLYLKNNAGNGGIDLASQDGSGTFTMYSGNGASPSKVINMSSAR